MTKALRVHKVLYIEDNPGDCSIVEMYLTDFGVDQNFDIEIKNTLSAGKAYLAKKGKDIDAVLLDLSLPDREGIDSLKELHGLFPEIPIVVLTGRNDDELGMEAVKNGAQDFIIKNHLQARLLRKSIIYAQFRKQAELQLKAKFRIYEDLVEDSNEAMALMDQNGQILDCNAAMVNLLGFRKKQEVKSLKSYDLLTEEKDKVKLRTGLHRLNGKSQKMMLTLRQQNGQQITCDTSVKINQNQSGERVIFNGLFAPITV